MKLRKTLLDMFWDFPWKMIFRVFGFNIIARVVTSHFNIELSINEVIFLGVAIGLIA